MDRQGNRPYLRHFVLVLVSGLALTATAACAGVPDTLQQRVAACSSCHGEHGEGGANGFNPRLAGKPKQYLYNQLVNFREGRRSYAIMQRMVSGLPNEYLHEIAAYFAEQTPDYPADLGHSVAGDVMQRGRKLVSEGDPGRNVPACSDCHGPELTGRQPAIPPLVGLPRDYIAQQLGHWRNGTRQAQAPDCMAKIAERLRPQDVNVVATWLAAQPAPETTEPAAASSELPMDCGSVQQ